MYQKIGWTTNKPNHLVLMYNYKKNSEGRIWKSFETNILCMYQYPYFKAGSSPISGKPSPISAHLEYFLFHSLLKSLFKPGVGKFFL